MPSGRQVAESVFELLLVELVCTARAQHGDDADKAVQSLTTLGNSVGSRLVEKVALDRARFVSTLDIVKFVCKELWNEAFGKQVDNLRTNHRGVFVLIDNKFRYLRHISPLDARSYAVYTAFACGLIAGALGALGLPCQVTAEVTACPATTFTVKLEEAKA
eukprot:TRINITY_DN578_c0_g1_i1.p4 TRINITY_DN578_c0_g1~~TRINITY_DN578_c0_g1_i1.p4  ORF type:complete len:161 (+),score=65.22 TRINITY_DN578_c0_g1_i1:834-1316(+)